MAYDQFVRIGSVFRHTISWIWNLSSSFSKLWLKAIAWGIQWHVVRTRFLTRPPAVAGDARLFGCCAPRAWISGCIFCRAATDAETDELHSYKPCKGRDALAWLARRQQFGTTRFWRPHHPRHPADRSWLVGGQCSLDTGRPWCDSCRRSPCWFIELMHTTGVLP